MSATLDELSRALAAGPVVAHGVTPGFAALAAARLAAAGGPTVVCVVAEPDAATRLADDVRFFLDDEPRAPGGDPTDDPVLELPAIDASPYAEVSPDRTLLVGRMTALYRLGHTSPRVVVASAAALLRRAIEPAELQPLCGVLVPGQTVDRDRLVELLLRAGFLRAPVVEDAGSFAVRGGVIDIFAPLYHYPVRVELDGDVIESLRLFDPDTQRTLRPLAAVHLHPVRDTVPTRGADVRARIRDAADTAAHPSVATRRLLEQIEQGGVFVGIEVLTPAFHTRMAPPWRYLPEDARWLIVDPDAVRRAAAAEVDGADERYRDRLAAHQIAFPPAEHWAAPAELEAFLASRRQRVLAPTMEILAADVDRAAAAAALAPAPTTLRFAVDDNRALRSELERARIQHADELVRPLADAIAAWRRDGWRVVIAGDSASRSERLVGLLGAYGEAPELRARSEVRFTGPPILRPGNRAAVIRGVLSAGLALTGERLAIVTFDDIFGPRKAAPAASRAAKRARDALLGSVEDFSQLSPGDFLVHQLHGVGCYRGLARLPVAQSGAAGAPTLTIDFLHLEYDGGTLYLPVYRLGEVQRYVGAEDHEPRLDKLGGLSWLKTRSKVSQKLRALAEELLQLYAQRRALPGHRFPPPDAVFAEFEATFPFEETPDQRQAIDDVLADMRSDRAMDRLVCGDVGYGKTEVALRAILTAALGGKQAALLAPTTVLVEQHFRTMSERFAGLPITLAKLSRFQSKAEQIATVRAIADGKIDAVVGTHRMLSNDVRFADLGLLVIDEEQRFGVVHKERLKKLRTQLDVLTLTATPIPRTLHLAMTGLRDLSIIATPPADRRAVRTLVARAEDSILRDAIQRELARGGQIFFVVRNITPRVGAGGDGGADPAGPAPAADGRAAAPASRPGAGQRERSIHQWADHLRSLVPEARIVVAHGQLPEAELERVMVGFVQGQADVLVSTTIIESGLDIPRANTMFVARADLFGLAQLYQLRGRIGRSSALAFCYLLVPPPEQLSDDARRRLEALQRFTELGAGFQIASHDLEIRGGGELLGARQSGTIAAVGFEAYIRMLEEAVAEVRGTPIHHPIDPELNLETPGYIPDDYVPDAGHRLDLYKRLASAADDDELRALLDEIGDRFGAVPGEVIHLADVMGLKALARRLRAQSLELTSTRLALAFGPDTPLPRERVLALAADKRNGLRFTQDGRLVKGFDAAEARAPVTAARACLLQLLACAT